jgi:riboflavin synthase
VAESDALFTGIIKGVGTLISAESRGGDSRLSFDLGGVEVGALELGASIAVNGVCLTVVDFEPGNFVSDVSTETLDVTTLAGLRPGATVNIEPSLRLGDALGGHWVSGHVDGVGTIADIRPAARSTAYTVELPPHLGRYVARKGSIAVDGVSLTVNRAEKTRFDVNIVPHTQRVTIIGGYRVGTAVNIEVDIVARYLERLILERDGNETASSGE